MQERKFAHESYRTLNVSILLGPPEGTPEFSEAVPGNPFTTGYLQTHGSLPKLLHEALGEVPAGGGVA